MSGLTDRGGGHFPGIEFGLLPDMTCFKVGCIVYFYFYFQFCSKFISLFLCNSSEWWFNVV